MLELLKVIVQPVLIERGDDSNIIGERIGNPLPLYTEEQVHEFFTALQEQLNEDSTAERALL